MKSEEELKELYDRVLEFQETEHKKNRRRIRNGFLSLIIVPAIFLVLLLTSDLTGTSKLVMLVIWVISMLIIASYLIVIEYLDFKVMHMLDDDEAGDNTSLTAGQEDE